MKFETIEDCLVWMQDGYSFSESLLDAINAHREGGKQALEELFTAKLWLSSDFEFASEVEKDYYIGLGRIEEILCKNKLIYHEESYVFQ